MYTKTNRCSTHILSFHLALPLLNPSTCTSSVVSGVASIHSPCTASGRSVTMSDVITTWLRLPVLALFFLGKISCQIQGKKHNFFTFVFFLNYFFFCPAISQYDDNTTCTTLEVRTWENGKHRGIINLLHMLVQLPQTWACFANCSKCKRSCKYSSRNIYCN